MAPAVDVLLTWPMRLCSDSYVMLGKQACMPLCAPFRVLLVVIVSDLHTGAVDMDPDIVSKICSSLNLDPLLSPLISDSERIFDDLVDTVVLI